MNLKNLIPLCLSVFAVKLLHKYKLLLTAIALCLFFYSCKTPSTNNPKKTFRLNFSTGTLESIDPAFAKDLYIMWTVRMVYNTLMETDEQLRLVPSLAKSWEISPDGLTYTFYIRDNVYFQDNEVFPSGKGRKMTAHDLVFSFNRLIDPSTASPGAWIFNERVAKTEPFTAIDDSTLQVHLSKPFRPLLQMLTMPYCSVVPHEAVEHWGKDFRSHPCGTGPFEFHYWDEGNMLVLHRNPNYWERDSNGLPLPYIDAVQASFYDSKATEFFLFLQHKLDWVNGVDGSFKDLVVSKDGNLKKEFEGKFHLTRQTYFNTEYIGFLTDTLNPLLKNNPLANPLVRRAINYAIDRNKIVTYFRNGMAIPATGGFIPAGMPGYDSIHSYGYTYDPAKAAQLLAEAGYPGGKGLVPFKVITPDNWVDVLNFVATQLLDAGIPMQVDVTQANIVKQQMSRSKALCFRGQWIADYPDAESYLVCFNSLYPAPPNYTRFSNPLFDKWYDQSLNAPDSLRYSLYRKMDSLAISYAPVIPLYYEYLEHFTQNNISGFHSNPMNLIDLKRIQIK